MKSEHLGGSQLLRFELDLLDLDLAVLWVLAGSR